VQFLAETTKTKTDPRQLRTKTVAF